MGEQANKRSTWAQDQDGAPLGFDAAEITLRETLARYEQAHVEHDGDMLRSCFHDDAIIESVASGGQPLGPDDTSELVRRALVDGIYEIRAWRYEDHAPEIVLVMVGARSRMLETGLSDETVFRVVIGRDGLIWRARSYGSRQAALEAIAHRATPNDWA